MFVEIHIKGKPFLANTDTILSVFNGGEGAFIIFNDEIDNTYVNETYEQMKELLIEPPIYIERPPMGEYDE
jgi:hypothetical protein